MWTLPEGLDTGMAYLGAIMKEEEEKEPCFRCQTAFFGEKVQEKYAACS